MSRRQLAVLVLIAAASTAAGAMHYAGAPEVATFIVAGLALAGLAWIVSFSTEALGERFGPGLTGLLQSTLGNLPEFFVVVFALNAGEILVAQTSLIGSLLANGLLVLGLTIIVGARASEGGVMRFHARLPNDTMTLLMLAVFVIVILGVANSSNDAASAHAEAISAIGAVCLLIVYAAWLASYLRADTSAAPRSSNSAIIAWTRGYSVSSAPPRKTPRSALFCAHRSLASTLEPARPATPTLTSVPR